MKTYADTVRRDVIDEIAKDIGECLRRAGKVHGDDPKFVAIIGLAFERVIRDIERDVHPNFRRVLVKRLQMESAS
ncbi:MAG TPA: hypothetical protein VFX37_09785 [Pseudolabrys sp.]|nr:hypothetical protein [Pseudolabrys sp.]